MTQKRIDSTNLIRNDFEQYKWIVLLLAALTHTLVVAMPAMSMPVLFDEISTDLSLTLVQVGWIWGLGSLMGIFMGLIGGNIGDRFGPKQVLIVTCFLAGVMGAARGLSDSFITLALTVFLLGVVSPMIPMNVHKTCGVWFSGPRLGLANGVVAVGMALGFMLGSLLAATVLSPWLGGWRNVLIFQGGIAILVSGFWWLTQDPEAQGMAAQTKSQRVPLSAAFTHVVQLSPLWILGIAVFGVAGCVQGTLGYLPLYLRELGWSGANADSALATFHATSMFAAIPIALLSDRLGRRRIILLTSAALMAISISFLAVADGPFIWIAVIFAGLTRDGFMGLFMTAIIEIKKVGATYAGTASGLVMVLLGLGNFLAPPIGNSLAEWGFGIPFLFWAGLGILGFVGLTFFKEK